jgi:LysW-gamma-L-lysine carboxypeptidase
MADSELQLLQQMVSIPSPSGQESRLACFLVDTMQSMGFRSYRDGVSNAIGIAGDGPKTIVLLGHIDTVAGDLPVRIEGGRLYGRGSVDAKGPMACFISSAHRLKQQLNRQGKKIVIVGAVEEESATSRGARQALSDLDPPDFCVIGEPSGWNAVTLGYKGRLLVDYRLQVPLRHTAGQGQSACEQAVDYWSEVRRWCDRFNTGASIFEGLQASLRSFNSSSDGIHETADLRLGFRIPMNFSLQSLEDFLLRTAEPAQVSFSGREAAIRRDKSNPLVRSFLRSIRDLKGRPKFKLKTGTADMNVVAPYWKCPMVAYGPGDSSLDHTPQEHVEIDEYRRSIDVLESVLRLL